ncbi:MAG: hypothetical protein ACREU4_00040 [Burkholderiales bacterium]
MSAGRTWRGTSAFHPARATISALVSNTCGSLPCGGTLCTAVPCAKVQTPGAPGASSTVNARCTLAATPGFSSWPIARASSSTERRWVAVRRKPSFAIRSW